MKGTSVGYMLLKQQSRARNQLKRVAKMNWTPEFGDDIEKSWLLLADVYIQSSKYDTAVELLKKVVTVNKCSAKAFEYLGFVKEKEANYSEASEHYMQAWRLQRECNPSIGFKLAFNQLKAKKYTDAIDVCHAVLKNNPEYPRIKKEIMDKARCLIRI